MSILGEIHIPFPFKVKYEGKKVKDAKLIVVLDHHSDNGEGFGVYVADNFTSTDSFTTSFGEGNLAEEMAQRYYISIANMLYAFINKSKNLDEFYELYHEEWSDCLITVTEDEEDMEGLHELMDIIAKYYNHGSILVEADSRKRKKSKSVKAAKKPSKKKKKTDLEKFIKMLKKNGFTHAIAHNPNSHAVELSSYADKIIGNGNDIILYFDAKSGRLSTIGTFDKRQEEITDEQPTA